jgi:hypothetical protein
MREALITTTLFTIYATTRGTALAIGAVQGISPSGQRDR